MSEDHAILPPADLFRLEGASYAVNHAVLVRPLSLVIPQGEIVGLIGRNGSGKTTLLKLLARQLSPSKGRISFADMPLEDWAPRHLARQLAYLPQYVTPATGMTVRDLVKLGRYPWHGPYGRFTDRDHAMVSDALKLTDMQGFADRLVEELSGGEKQRAWLAMLVAQESRCLLLDEPLAALDVACQIDVLHLLQQLQTERGVSIVLVLHDINLAAQHCDRLVSMRGGDLLLQGSPADLMTGGNLEAIYGVPMCITTHPETGGPVGFVR